MVVPAIGCQGGYRANGSLLIIHGILYLFLKITHNTMHFIFIWFILNMCILCRSLIVLSGHYSHCNHGLKPSSSLSTPFYCKFFLDSVINQMFLSDFFQDVLRVLADSWQFCYLTVLTVYKLLPCCFFSHKDRRVENQIM